ncbi:hypothetical protein [Longispora albida]|uniref:hypothetical protein n=1 Tax=Longispora albida TaxID=203523 RepID=UPI00036507B8|nr:hypothetical protein [Longispora albida]
MSAGAYLVAYLAYSVLMSACLVMALLYSATGAQAFSHRVYTALTTRIDELNSGQAGRAHAAGGSLLVTVLLRWGPRRGDLLWARGVHNRAGRTADLAEREMGYRSLLLANADDDPRTKRLRLALQEGDVAKGAEGRGARYAVDLEARIHTAGSYPELRWLQWKSRWVRLQLLAEAVRAPDMKARWIPFSSRFLDYLGRGGACGLVVASAIGGSRVDMNGWSAWISYVSVVGGAIGSVCFCLVSIRDIASAGILPDNAFNRWVGRYPLVAAVLFPAAVALLLAFVKNFER